MTLACRDATLNLRYPAPSLVLALDRTGRQIRLHVEDAARDVVPGSALNDRVPRHDDAPDGHAVSHVRVRHKVRADHALVARAARDLLPDRLLGCLKEGLRQKG